MDNQTPATFAPFNIPMLARFSPGFNEDDDHASDAIIQGKLWVAQRPECKRYVSVNRQRLHRHKSFIAHNLRIHCCLDYRQNAHCCCHIHISFRKELFPDAQQ